MNTTDSPMDASGPTGFHLPASLIDTASLPPLILTSEAGSFAHNTLKMRVPAILRETLEQTSFPSDVRAALQELHAELVGGTIRGLHEDAPDVAFWNEVSAPHLGRSWLDVPWYWAEAYFYRRVLEATGYFRPGIEQGRDPYLPKKRSEWMPEAAPRRVDALLAGLPDDETNCFEQLLHASLWGNRTDLSYMVAAHLGGTANVRAERENLLVDDTAEIWRFLARRHAARLVIIADNTGTELLADLALADFLLRIGIAGEIMLHLKPQPFFVSDAMPQDLLAGLFAMAAGGKHAAGLAGRLVVHLHKERLKLAAHWASATSLFYFQLPDDLVAELAAADLVFIKGDANYRRLVGDAHWPPTTPFAQAVGYFPAPLIVLRTLKSELIVGLPPGAAQRLADEDRDWLVNGQRGVIQARLAG
jgi:uncharacterized protein with ATP-grasp and redox domains